MHLDYYYQQEAVDAVFSYLDAKPLNHPLIVAPTGSGKSHIIASLCEKILEQGNRVLVLSHVKEILLQDEKKLRLLLPPSKVGLYSAGAKRRERRDVTVAGIQSVYEKAHLFKTFTHVIIDEAHLIPKEGEGRYLTFLDEMPPVTVIGLTATPFRLGTGRLTEGDGKIFDDVAYDIDIVKLIKEKYLSPLRTMDAKNGLHSEKIKKQGGDFQQKDLGLQFDKYHITRKVVDELINYKEKRKSWLVFAIDIDHCNHIVEMLQEGGIDALAVHSKRTSDENDAAMRGYQKGECQALVSVAKMTTGFDAPRTDLIVLLRHTQSPVLHVQMIGRGLRIYNHIDPTYTDCLVLDFVGNLMRMGPINDVRIKVKGKGGGAAPMKSCPECCTHLPTSTRVCYICGYEFPKLESAELTNIASSELVIADRHTKKLKEAWQPVTSVMFREHKGKKGPSLCIVYSCGIRTFKKWLAVGRKGRGGMHAEYFWEKNSRFSGHPDYHPPKDVPTALKRANKGELNEPTEVYVSETGDYPEITSYRYSRPSEDSSTATL